MASDLLLNALRSMEFTQGFTPKQLEKLAAISTYVSFSEGATLFHEGDDSELVFLIQEGEVSLFTQVPGQGQVTILTIGPGQLLGWSSLFPPQKKTAGAQTNLPTKVISIQATYLAAVCAEDHARGFEIMSRVAQVSTKRLIAARNLIMDTFEAAQTKKK